MTHKLVVEASGIRNPLGFCFIPTCSFREVLLQRWAESSEDSFPGGRCVWALLGRLEDPVDDHRVWVRLPVGKHRALPFPH